MQKFLLLMAATMTAMSVSAENIQFPWFQQRNQAETEMIQHFLSTEIGKNFSEQQVLDVMQQPAAASLTPSENNVVLLNESFDKWTAGTNDAPDASIVNADDQEAVDALCDVPGWTAFLCSQAGGAVYQSYDEVGEDGPGYLMTPNLDMTQHQGVLRFRARVKNVNANATENGLQYFVLDNNPDKKGMISANVCPMTYGEYTEVEFVCRATSAYTAVMFYSWQGKVLVDEVLVEDVIYALATPSNIKIEAVSGTQIKVSCDAVEGATKYAVTAQSRKSDESYTVVSDTNEAIITGQFDPAEDVIVSIVASNDTDESYPGTSYGPISYTGTIDAPVALEATNVSNQGFTANWEPSLWANTYELTLNRTHTVGEEGETFYYVQEDFSEIPYTTDDTESTVMTSDGSVVSLDNYINAKGWNVYLASCFTGGLALTNMYEAYGFPGLMVSDEKDFSLGGGKVRISGAGMSLVDDVVMKVGFASATNSMFGKSYNFLDGAKEFELSTTGSVFDVEIEGGTENSMILFKMVDASSSGDMAVFAMLNISAEAAPGDQVASVYDIVTLPASATSYDVEVDFPEGDSFSYSVVGKFGNNASASSEVINVEAPAAVGLDRVEVNKQFNAIYTLDGRRVAAENISDLEDGTYIVRRAHGSSKIMK